MLHHFEVELDSSSQEHLQELYDHMKQGSLLNFSTEN